MASSNLSMLSKTGNNEYSDECYTPQNAVLPLLYTLDPTLIYYECTSRKSSSILNTFRNHGIDMVGSEDRDFLKDDIPDGIDVIITNPPYSKKDQFIKRCYEIGKPFALLLPVSSLQGQKRGKLFDRYGIEIMVLNNRVDFTGGGAPHFGVAWFCHNILPQKLIFINNE